MPSCCITYTTDATYLLPTLVSAIGARRNASRELADVVVFCLDLDARTDRLFAPICDATGVVLMNVNSEVVEGAPAMMSRLFLTRFVPATYDQFLYMDGDVLVSGSLDPLLETTVPAGSFLAANDPFTFLLEDDTRQSRDLRAHLRRVDIGPEMAGSYFNTGVLRIARRGWEAIGARSWERYSRCKAFSRFPDQDAMNYAAAGNRLPMSLRWNYPIFLNNVRLESEIKPRIRHFMSSPKPWQGNFAPWTDKACEPYRTFLRKYPQTAAYLHPLPMHQWLKYSLQQRLKQGAETLTWSYSERRERVLSYERMCARIEREKPRGRLQMPLEAVPQ